MIEFTRILCAVDRSEPSRRALECALWWARAHGADLSVLEVHPLVAVGSETRIAAEDVSLGTPDPPVLAPPLTPEERNSKLLALEDFIFAGRTDGLHIEVLIDSDVSVADAIVARADALAADMIVLGAGQMAGRAEHAALGQVTTRVLHSASCSVLTVPPPAADTVNPSMGRLRRLLCPVDLTDTSRQTLDCAAALAAEASAHLSVLHVVELSEVAALAYDWDEHREVRIEPACAQLVELIADAVGDTKPVEEIVAAGAAPAEILKMAEECEADLIVMGARGSERSARTGAKSTGEAVARHAHSPVLFVGREIAPAVVLDREPTLVSKMGMEPLNAALEAEG
jgi:nucleotide-binding universal stress UspA family protein